MKIKALSVFVILILLLPCAFAEAMPDGSCFSAFAADCDCLEGWERIDYFVQTGLILCAYREDAEITVSVEESTSETAAEFLNEHVSSMSRIARIISKNGPDPCELTLGSDAANLRYTFMYLRGTDTDDVYTTDIYALPLTDGAYLVVSLSVTGQDTKELLSFFEDEFAQCLKIGVRTISNQFMAYLRSAELIDGEIYLTLDFCTLEYDASIYTIYTKNTTEAEYTYRLSEDARLFLPIFGEGIYRMRQSDADIDGLNAAISGYYANNDEDGIYNVLFNEDNQIIWLMHYNAY